MQDSGVPGGVRTLPALLRLEVKTTRRAALVLDERDLEGIRPDGHLVALVTPRRMGGPRWVVVPAARLAAGTARFGDLLASAVEPALSAGLQRVWEEWLLDADVRRQLLAGGASGLRERVRWCRGAHPPRAHRGRGAVRAARLDAALAALRTELERDKLGGAQLEGQLHQLLIEDALIELGYAILPNPIGVPDITARLAPVAGAAPERSANAAHGAPPAPTSAARRRAALAAWRPSTPALGAVRNALLALDDEELAALDALWP